MKRKCEFLLQFHTAPITEWMFSSLVMVVTPVLTTWSRVTCIHTCACKRRSESCFLIWKKTLTKIGWYNLLSYTQLLPSALPSFIISYDFVLKQPLWLGQCASLSLRLFIMWSAKKTHKAACSMWTVDVHFSNAFFSLKLYLMPPLSLYNILLSFLLYVFPSFTLHHGMPESLVTALSLTPQKSYCRSL